MTWQNIFDLGDVDLYWSNSITGELQPIASLPSGSVLVVDGVIQCRDLPENYNGAGVGTIVAVPSTAQAATAPSRATLDNVNIPLISAFSSRAFCIGVAPVPDNGIPVPVDLTPTEVGQVVTALTPAQSELGDFPASDAPLPGLQFSYSETET